MVLEDGNEVQHPQVELYAPGATSPTAVIDLPHKVRGRYEASWTPPSADVWSAQFFVYADAAHTVENITYTRSIEQIVATNSSIDDLSSRIIRILGLVHENAFIDNTVHNAEGSLVAARVRIFDSRAAVEAATDGGSETAGLIATYEIETTYEADCRMGSYRMKLV
jgi:hypothetical protein